MDTKLFGQVYASIANKETTFDGIYYTGVKTTKIVCRPSCRARTPKRENITLYPSVDAAIKDGFRPCKRCKPEENGKHGPDAVLVEQANAILAARFTERISLEVLAAQLKISPFHLQRVYKRAAGRSPAQFVDEKRLETAKQLLKGSELEVKEIAAQIGFRSAAHFTKWFKQHMQQIPTQFRQKERMTNGC